MDQRWVIIQFGKSSTKVGFDGDHLPRAIIKTPELRQIQTRTDLVEVALSEVDWIFILEPLLKRIFFYYLNAAPPLHRIILIEHEFLPRPFRAAFSKILFNNMKVPAIYFLSEMSTPLYLTHVNTGFIIDIGYSSTRILPIVFGSLIREAYKEIPIGCMHVDQELNSLYKKIATDQILSESIIEKLKIVGCYVRFIIPTDDEDIKLETDKDITLNLEQNIQLVLPAALRWEACEILFKNSPETNNTIIDTCMQSLKLCNIEQQYYAVENIILCGGGAQLKGFQYRFAYNFKTSLKESFPYLASRSKFIRLNCPELIRQWVGASICAASNILLLQNHCHEIHLEQWKKSKILPDWIVPEELNVYESLITPQILETAKDFSCM